MYFKLYFWEKQKQRKNVIGGIFYPASSVNTLFYITRIYVFCLAFILNENILFWLTISYQKPFVFSVSVFWSQIFTLKLNLQPNIGLTYAISIVKRFFGKYFWKYFLLFFAEFELLMFHNNIVKIWEKMNKWKLLKICLQVTYPTDFYKICILFYYMGKSENIWFFKNQWQVAT